MKKQPFYRQCNLTKKTEDSELRQVSWIPEKFAVKDKFVKLKEGNEWEDGYKVCSVGDHRASEQEVNAMKWYHTKHRKHSDI